MNAAERLQKIDDLMERLDICHRTLKGLIKSTNKELVTLLMEDIETLLKDIMNFYLEEVKNDQTI